MSTTIGRALYIYRAAIVKMSSVVDERAGGGGVDLVKCRHLSVDLVKIKLILILKE